MIIARTRIHFIRILIWLMFMGVWVSNRQLVGRKVVAVAVTFRHSICNARCHISNPNPRLSLANNSSYPDH